MKKNSVWINITEYKGMSEKQHDLIADYLAVLQEQTLCSTHLSPRDFFLVHVTFSYHGDDQEDSFGRYGSHYNDHYEGAEILI